jgi:hypothetical protein
MKLVQAVLRGIAEDQPLQDQGDLSIALIGLADAYNSLHERCADHVEITEASTGRQLMKALAHLKLKDQVTLLHLYRDSVRMIHRANSQPPPELAPPGKVTSSDPLAARLAALEAEERIKFRALARKVVLFAAAPIPPLLAGSMVAISWQKGNMVDNVIAKGLMSTATEMLKLIFSI